MPLLPTTKPKKIPKKSASKKKLSSARRRAILVDEAEHFLRSRNFPIDALLKRDIRDMPAHLARKVEVPTDFNATQKGLLVFAEYYARFLFFKSPRHKKDIAKACLMRMDLKRAHKYAGLIACIIDTKRGYYDRKRDAVSKLRSAFMKCAADFESPATIASGKSKHGKSWTALAAEHALHKSPLQLLGREFPPGTAHLGLLVITKKGDPKVMATKLLKSGQHYKQWNELTRLLK